MRLSSSIQFLSFLASAVISVDGFLRTNKATSFSRGLSSPIKLGKADHIGDVANEIQFFNATTLPGSDNNDVMRSFNLMRGVTADNSGGSKLDASKLEFVPTCGTDDLEACSVDGLYEQMTGEQANIEGDETSYPYVDMIRGSAPYIANHRGELAVIHVPGDFLAYNDLTDFMNDIALCWLLGMKIVIVVGCRKQVEDRLKSMGVESYMSGHTRITSKEEMRIIEEEAGFARFEVERLLHRSLRCSQLSTSTDGNVVSGNFFKASPFGVVDGVDFQNTGRPRQLNVRRILDYLKAGEIVLMTSIGVDQDGECLNVNSEALTAFTAASLCANKLVFCCNNGMVLRDKETQKTVQNFRAKDARTILEHFHLDVRKNYFMSHERTENLQVGASEMLVKIAWATKAIRDGVERAHIIAPSNGALIEELFTAKQGTGTCISEDTFESIHPDDDSGDFDFANDFVYSPQSEDDPEWPTPTQKPEVKFPWQHRPDHY